MLPKSTAEIAKWLRRVSAKGALQRTAHVGHMNRTSKCFLGVDDQNQRNSKICLWRWLLQDAGGAGWKWKRGGVQRWQSRR